jgi:tetratricopeptide (TPR) repeat protein
MNAGRQEEAIGIFEEAAESAPFGPREALLSNLAAANAQLGRFEEARRWSEMRRDPTSRTNFAGLLAVMEARWDEVEQLALALIADTTLPPRGRWEEAWQRLASVRAVRGRVRSAFHALDRSLGATGPTQSGNSLEGILRLSLASGVVPDDLDLPPLRSEEDRFDTWRILSALWALHLGDSAEPVLPDTPSWNPKHDPVALLSPVGAWHLLYQARLAASREEWATVVEVLRPVLTPGPWEQFQSPRPLMEWTIAESLENLGMPDSATVHFAALAEAPWIFRGYTYSFARRRAALLYGQIGDRQKAIDHWRIFLEAFTDPDPDLEWMVEEGRAELARLEGDAGD